MREDIAGPQGASSRPMWETRRLAHGAGPVPAPKPAHGRRTVVRCPSRPVQSDLPGDGCQVAPEGGEVGGASQDQRRCVPSAQEALRLGATAPSGRGRGSCRWMEGPRHDDEVLPAHRLKGSVRRGAERAQLSLKRRTIGAHTSTAHKAPQRKTGAGLGFMSAPDRIRTCDLMLRRHALYPTELRAQRPTSSHRYAIFRRFLRPCTHRDCAC